MAAEFAIQRGLFQAISALGFRTHDVAPQDPSDGAFPFVEIGVVVLAAMDTKDRNGFDFAARIHTRDRADSMERVKLIQGAVYDRLHHGDLVVDGYRTLLVYREMSDCSRVAEASLHGVCEYRGLIEAI